jgi:predicted O-methyltransferase YrrM
MGSRSPIERNAMDADVAVLLDELHRYGVEHDADKPDRVDRLRNLEPDSAQLLALLVRAVGAGALLELGTSNGYSTVWLADAVRATGGKVTSVDTDAERSTEASRNLTRAGLQAYAELRVQDAVKALRESADHQWDMIFLDAERPAYTTYWADLQRTLRPGGLLAVDNVISHADQVDAFRSLVRETPGVFEALAPTGAGLLLVVKAPRTQTG